MHLLFKQQHLEHRKGEKKGKKPTLIGRPTNKQITQTLPNVHLLLQILTSSFVFCPFHPFFKGVMILLPTSISLDCARFFQSALRVKTVFQIPLELSQNSIYPKLIPASVNTIADKVNTLPSCTNISLPSLQLKSPPVHLLFITPSHQ